MSLTVLSVAHPLAPVCQDAVGGAEQVLVQLDRALVRAGYNSVVLAAHDSRTTGRLVPIPEKCGSYRADTWAQAHVTARRLLKQTLARDSVDVVHIHALAFAALLPRNDIPMLVTLHLPRQYYADDDLQIRRPNTWMNCVSRSQHQTFVDCCELLAPIENGVAFEAAPVLRGERSFALWLGRICPEKGLHVAIEACVRAGIPLMIGGKTFPYPVHVDYFDREIAPRLSEGCRFLGAVGGAHKRRLLQQARCVIVSTLVQETSSLVAREALAAGTPVIALRSSGLNELIDHGITGFLVDDEQTMAEAVRAAANLDPEACVLAARERCPLERMTSAYLRLYETLAAYRSLQSAAHE